MDLIIIVAAIGILITMVVLMFRYAGFIHQGPDQDKYNEKQGKGNPDVPSDKDSE